MGDENLIKTVCKELGLTYRELAEAIGVTESTIKTNATQEQITQQLRKAVELLVENAKLKERLTKMEAFQASLKSFME